MKLLKTFVLLGGFILPCNVIALPDNTCLRISDIYGSTSYFIADETLNLQKDGDNIIISSPNSVVRLNSAQLKNFGYEERTLCEITNVTPDNAYIYMEGDILRIISASVKDSSACCIYDMNGMLLNSFVYSDEAVIDTKTYSPGVYLIKIDNLPAIKFVVR